MPIRGRILAKLVIAALVLPCIAVAQESSLQKAWGNVFIETCAGFADLPKAFVQIGDPEVIEIPNAKGYAKCMGGGIQARPWIRIQFEWEKEIVEGTGSFVQASSNPAQSGGAVGKFGINTDSKMFAIEFDLWSKHRFHPFVGAGIGKTTVASHFIGSSQGYSVIENDKDRIPDGTGRAGFRFKLKNGLELTFGAYGKDNVSAMGVITFFPGRFFSRTGQ